jgi:hypothetical protein
MADGPSPFQPYGDAHPVGAWEAGTHRRRPARKTAVHLFAIRCDQLFLTARLAESTVALGIQEARQMTSQPISGGTEMDPSDWRAVRLTLQSLWAKAQKANESQASGGKRSDADR